MTFGHVADATHPTAIPGLVVTSGALTSLDMTVDSTFTVSSVTVTATNLELTYTAATSQFSMTGAASVAIAGIGALDVTFGHVADATHPAAIPGLVVTSGALTSLDMTVDSSFTVDDVNFSTTGLNFTYTSASGAVPSRFTMTGAASAAIGGMGSVSVTFGHDATPGLVITGGKLTSLDLTVDGQFTVSAVTIAARTWSSPTPRPPTRSRWAARPASTSTIWATSPSPSGTMRRRDWWSATVRWRAWT